MELSASTGTIQGAPVSREPQEIKVDLSVKKIPGTNTGI